MSSYRNIKHFILTLEKGRIHIANACEVVPYHTYEIIKFPPVSTRFVNMNTNNLKEDTEKTLSLTLQNFTEDATQCEAIPKRKKTRVYRDK